MSSITNVPLDLIRPSLEIPDSPVVLSKGREDNKSFTGSAFHPNVLGWTQSVVRPMESDDSHGQDPSRGARSYGVTLPSSEVCIPENPSFQHKDKVGWCCDLVTTDIHCTVSDAKGRDGIPSSEAPHTQKCQVQWTLVLDPGIAGCLEDETLTQSHPESPKANNQGSIATGRSEPPRLSLLRGSARGFTPNGRRLDDPGHSHTSTPSKADASGSAPPPFHHGQTLHLKLHHGPLLSRNIGTLADKHDLLPDGEDFSVEVFSFQADDPTYTPVKTTGTLVVPVATVRREIEKQYPGCPFSDQAALSITRNFVKYKNPSLPGDGGTSADLPYDERMQEFAHTAEEFCSWTGSLQYYPGVNIEGTLRLKHSVDPKDFPWLAKQAKSEQPVVLGPRDYVSQ